MFETNLGRLVLEIEEWEIFEPETWYNKKNVQVFRFVFRDSYGKRVEKLCENSIHPSSTASQVIGAAFNYSVPSNQIDFQQLVGRKITADVIEREDEWCNIKHSLTNIGEYIEGNH